VLYGRRYLVMFWYVPTYVNIMSGVWTDEVKIFETKFLIIELIKGTITTERRSYHPEIEERRMKR
jgi:hypothetical protein